MSVNYTFTEDFLDSLAKARKDLDILLVTMLRVAQSENIPENNKISIRDNVVQIAHEVNAFFGSIKIADITKMTVREVEKKVIEKIKDLHKDIEEVINDLSKRYNIKAENKNSYDIPSIIRDLSLARLHGDYAITLDKIGNLQSVKAFINRIYESQVGTDTSKDNMLDKELQRIKEKSFSESIKGAEAQNAEYFYKTVEIIKKMISDGKEVIMQIGDDEHSNRDIFRFQTKGENKVKVQYRFNGLGLIIDILKTPLDKNIEYNIVGSIEKGVSKIDYKIKTKIEKQYLEQKERLLGVDYLWAQYDKAFLAFQKSENIQNNTHENLDKANIDKAINDILFN
jgi:hypothetical protein